MGRSLLELIAPSGGVGPPVALGWSLLPGDWRRRRLRHGCRAGSLPVLTLMDHTDAATTSSYVASAWHASGRSSGAFRPGSEAGEVPPGGAAAARPAARPRPRRRRGRAPRPRP